MQYRKFGNTGLEMAALGLGTMRLPTKRFRLQKVDVPKAVEMIRAYIDMGGNYIDTAWFYHFGESERVTGLALQDGYREKVHLVTKLPMMLLKKKEDFDRYLDAQLERLGVDSIDTYLFHSMNAGALEKVKRFNLLEDMERARSEGTINYIGFSFHDTLPVFKQIVDLYNWDVIQIQYNYMDVGAQATTEGLKYAAATGAAIVIMEPVRGGQLAKPPKEAQEVIGQSSVKRTPVDWALQFLWDLPEVSVVLSGMSNMKQLKENVESAGRSGANTLSAEERNTINRLTDIYNSKILVDCTGCQYCMNCPYGVNIPGVFAAVNNKNMDKNILMKIHHFRSTRKLVKKKEKLNTEKNNGGPSLCTDCGVCIPKCPQGIDIPTEMTKAKLVLEKGKKIKDVYGTG